MATPADIIRKLMTKKTSRAQIITSTEIAYPLPDVQYQIKSHYLARLNQACSTSSGELSSYVTFEFDFQNIPSFPNVSPTVVWIDPLTNTYETEHHSVFFSPSDDEPIRVCAETLPVLFNDLDIPIMQYCGAPDVLYAVVSHKLSIDGVQSIQISARRRLDLRDRPLYTLNQIMHQEYSQQLGADIAVHTSNYPIFKSLNPPRKEKLDDLFNQFILNNQSLLAEQYKATKNKCHIRAHFINYCLKAYGIDSYKIFKFWDFCAWEDFDDNPKGWDYHCAVLIRDDEGNDWIWDPWEVCATELIPLRHWIIREREPRPKAVMVTPSFMVHFPYCPEQIVLPDADIKCYATSKLPLVFLDAINKNSSDYRAFQALYGSVAKSSIEKNFGNPYALFQPETKEQKRLKYCPSAAKESSCDDRVSASSSSGEAAP